MACDNTAIRNGQFTQTRPYAGWTTCPRCNRPALLIGYLNNYGNCSTCGVWDAAGGFIDLRKVPAAAIDDARAAIEAATND